jgi:hypothetical protein
VPLDTRSSWDVYEILRLHTHVEVACEKCHLWREEEFQGSTIPTTFVKFAVHVKSILYATRLLVNFVANLHLAAA